MTKKRRQFWFALTWAPLGAFFFTAAQPQNPNTTIGTVVFGLLGIACMITPIPLLCRWAKTPTPPRRKRGQVLRRVKVNQREEAWVDQ